MRILHVIRGLANSSGTTHIVGPLAEAQALQGHQVRVLYVEKPHEKAVVPNLNLVESEGFPMGIPTEHFGWSRAFRATIASRVRWADIVHIHAIWNFPTWCAMREAYSAGVPYVVAPQGSLEPWALNRSRYVKRLYARLFEKPYFDFASAMHAVTHVEAAQCKEFGIKAPARVLPNGITLADVDAAAEPLDLRDQLSLPLEAILLLFLGRLCPKKGIDLLIRAFARLVAERKELFLLIAGTDAGTGYGAAVETMVRACGIAGRTVFLGELKGVRKFQILRGVDAFVLPSYSEGLPMAVLEALACRCPVIVTTNCNLPDVQACDAGWVVEASVDGVCQALTEAVNCAAKRRHRGENGRRLIEGKYTWDRIARNSLKLYAGC